MKKYFQELKIFEDDRINQLCDILSDQVLNITGNELMICGSVSKVFAGEFLESYFPKDIDFIVHKWAFHLLIKRLENLPNVVMIEKTPDKIILYTQYSICIEIWYITNYNAKMTKQFYKNTIPYLYGN